MRSCSNCGGENPDEAAFCMACGASLAPAPAPHEQRKTVTIVFCDVTGSTALGERLDPEALRRVMSRYFDEMKVSIERPAVTEEDHVGVDLDPPRRGSPTSDVDDLDADEHVVSVGRRPAGAKSRRQIEAG